MLLASGYSTGLRAIAAGFHVLNRCHMTWSSARLVGQMVAPVTDRRATLAVTFICLALGGCAAAPRVGDIVHARVAGVVGEQQFRKVQSKDQDEATRNPYSYQDIQGAIANGVTIEDVREGRLVFASCRYGSNSGKVFIVLVPKGVTLGSGHRVDMELVAGASFTARGSGSLSTFRRLLPERAVGRTDCLPEAN